MISCFASGEEIRHFAQKKGINPVQLAHMQIAYLYHVYGMNRSDISALTGYATSTLSKMRKSVIPLVETSKQFFEVKPVKIVNSPHESVKVIRQVRKKTKGRTININFLENCGADEPKTQQAYLFKFYTGDREIPIFSKIGTTAVSVNKRVRQEIEEYSKRGFNIESVDICKIFNCGELPAESYESFLRAFLIKEYPNTWKKNDRFFAVNIPTELFLSICNKYAKF